MARHDKISVMGDKFIAGDNGNSTFFSDEILTTQTGITKAMSTELDSWKYFNQENVQSNDAGEKTLGALPGTVDELKPSFSMPLMLLQGIMGGVGFFGVINAMRSIKGVFDSGVAIELMKKCNPHGLDAQGLAMAQSHQDWMFLIITCAIIKLFISCGFMGAAVMLEKRVDHAHWIAGIICFGAIVYNLVEFGLGYMMLPDFTQHGISRSEADMIMSGLLVFMAGFFLVKMVIYVGLIIFLNNKTNTAIFTPKAEASLA